MLKVVEAFSGIGSQNKALKKLKKEMEFEYEIVNTIEWDVNAIFAYDIIHNGTQDLTKYKTMTRQEVLSKLEIYDLSLDGTEPMKYEQLKRFNDDALMSLLCAIERTKNLISIKKVKASDFKDDIDIFTYSFPCQDLSLSGYFHGDKGGINRDAGNSSSMLWEVERILFDFVNEEKKLPQFLLMENVSSIESRKHIDNFKEWQHILEDLGYINHVVSLSAEKFGIPQKRKRTFMISAQYGGNAEIAEIIKNRFSQERLLNFDKGSKNLKSTLTSILKTDYTNSKYYNEASEQIPNDTPSRKKILAENPYIINEDGELVINQVRTLTTKQDRNPNSGIIRIDNTLLDGREGKSKFRYLTPRESFMLMGFEEDDFDRLVDNDIPLSTRRNILTKTKLSKLAGNSIVVDVIKEVFREIIAIKELIDQSKN